MIGSVCVSMALGLQMYTPGKSSEHSMFSSDPNPLKCKLNTTHTCRVKVICLRQNKVFQFDNMEKMTITGIKKQAIK